MHYRTKLRTIQFVVHALTRFPSRYGSHLNANRGGGSGGGLFDAYDQSQRMSSRSPAQRPNSGYGNRYGGTPEAPQASQNYNNTSSPYSTYEPAGPSFSAYPPSFTPQKATSSIRGGNGSVSMAELEHMESQSDEQVSSILGKIGRLKDLTNQIGDEIRSSSNLADTMNDGFSVTSQRLRGTMRRMLRMAEGTGVGWRVWLGFFAVVVLLFWYVWLF